jgi:hypothetical protein
MASSVRDWRSNTSLRPRQPKPRYLRARVDLALGYRKSNESPVLGVLLSRLDELVARVSKKA